MLGWKDYKNCESHKIYGSKLDLLVKLVLIFYQTLNATI